MRTAPSEQQPGHFTTVPQWSDPFRLLAMEDPNETVAAVLSQEAVDSEYSGATAHLADDDLVEGVPGTGEAFMQGLQAPVPSAGWIVGHLLRCQRQHGAEASSCGPERKGHNSSKTPLRRRQFSYS